MLGPTVHDSAEVVPKSRKSSTPQEPPFPRQLEGDDVITVELTQSGSLRRFLNGTLVNTVPTECRPEGAWYAAFEVSFKVASVELIADDNVPCVHNATAGSIVTSASAVCAMPLSSDAFVAAELCKVGGEPVVQDEKCAVFVEKSQDLLVSHMNSQEEFAVPSPSRRSNRRSYTLPHSASAVCAQPLSSDAFIAADLCKVGGEPMVQDEKCAVFVDKSEDLLVSHMNSQEAFAVPSPSRRSSRRSYTLPHSFSAYSDNNYTFLHDTAAGSIASLAAAGYAKPMPCGAFVAAELNHCGLPGGYARMRLHACSTSKCY
jgi:hypothetical protein